MPKPPPMSPFSRRKARRRLSPKAARAARAPRRRLTLRVERRAPASCTPIAQRGSSAIAFSRWLCSSMRVTCAASERRLSQQPPCHSHKRFRGDIAACLLHRSGAPGSTALRGSTTQAAPHARGRRAPRHPLPARASRQRPPPPAGRRRTPCLRRAACAAAQAMGEPSARLKSGGNGMCFTPSARRSCMTMPQ